MLVSALSIIMLIIGPSPHIIPPISILIKLSLFYVTVAVFTSWIPWWRPTPASANMFVLRKYSITIRLRSVTIIHKIFPSTVHPETISLLNLRMPVYSIIRISKASHLVRALVSFSTLNIH